MGGLDKTKPCSHREPGRGGCQIPWDEHTHDTVLFVSPRRDGVTAKELHEVLHPLTKVAEHDGIDGFGLKPGTDADGADLTFNLEETT